MALRNRLSIAASIAIFPALPLAGRLVHLQVISHSRLESRANSEFERRTQDLVARADILDRNGKILAHSVPTWSCFVDKTMAKAADDSARKIAHVLKLPYAEVSSKLRAPGRFAWLKTGLSHPEMSEVAAARLGYLGLVAAQERVYPNDGMAEGLLGDVNNEGKGAAGLELAFDSQLAGATRHFETIRDGSGQMIYKAAEEPEAPPALQLALDRSVQFFAEDALKEAAAKFSIKSGIVAVQDPRNGEILALASYPSDRLRAPAVQDPFEPGSTFKIIAAAASIEKSVIRDDETVFCENGKFEIAKGVKITDHEPEGDLTLSQIIERSSNIGVAKLAQKLGANNFFRYSRAFGFAGKTGVPMPGEASGTLRPVGDMTPVTLAASAYGYGVSATAMQLLGAYSAVANGGTLWEPQVLAGKKPSKIRRVAEEATIKKLSGILEKVVEKGTGVQAQIPGYRVAGKTGTARRLDPDGRYSTSRYTASFIGYVPASRPELTILVVIDEPKGQYYGAYVAAPVFAKLGKQILALRGTPPDRESRLASAK
jgi:cell division protein FtsI (penicillin-binding protein 3)